MKARIPGQNNQSMNQMLKAAQQMQDDVKSKQDELEEKEYTADAANGMVEVTVTGAYEVKSVKINPDAVDPEDVEMLEDFVTLAVNNAISAAKKDSDEQLGAITGALSGMGLPGMF